MAFDEGVKRGQKLERGVLYERLRRAGLAEVAARFEREDSAGIA